MLHLFCYTTIIDFTNFFFNCIFLNFLAPTVLNMSPECSLSGPPSIRNANMNEVGQSEDIHGHLMHNGDELSGKHTMQFRFVYFQFVIRISNRDSDFGSNELKIEC